MANRRRGEISARIDGREWTLCLTLGALAELEDAFGAADLGELARRLASGPLSARQLALVVAAGLRGGGHDVSDEEVAEMRCEGGVGAMAGIVAELLGAAFDQPAPRQRPGRREEPPDPCPPQDG